VTARDKSTVSKAAIAGKRRIKCTNLPEIRRKNARKISRNAHFLTRHSATLEKFGVYADYQNRPLLFLALRDAYCGKAKNAKRKLQGNDKRFESTGFFSFLILG
jgi:hypothetical protein